jgi:cyclophilin family peptidyl-prolyl cis-trans isomerase
MSTKSANKQPNKQHPVKSKRKQSKTNSNNYMQWGAIAVIVLVLAGIIYLVVSSQKPAASNAVVPTASGTKQFASAPAMSIDKSKQYSATVKMAKGGEFVIQLYADKAPITVNSFVFLARQGFFNGVTFHRVLDGFMAQGGDPTGTGMGGPGYKFQNEDSDLKFDKAGVVAMANAGRDTNGSQFFITFGATPQLNGGYTIFGQVTSGMDVVNGITRRDPTANPTTQGDVIESITITEK